ncbi:hypothetical protein Poly30_08120 [Planctomycetes bacterium Poly30]|uniref:Uncharacterized protein n=1 Tax=Saltatorellus ferox TaxID=2528018 RepID=A0A518EML0_9BACT|nr:hypothetical protein Poly30_08120 [Planctomycetes bacterium Poly30]
MEHGNLGAAGQGFLSGLAIAFPSRSPVTNP